MCSSFSNYFRAIIAIIKLAQYALKELVGSGFVCMILIATLLKMCILQDKLDPELFVDIPRECGWNKYLRSRWSSLQLLLAVRELL